MNAVCRVLLERLYVKGLWSDDDPTETALRYLETDGGQLLRGERCSCSARSRSGTGTEKLPFADIFNLDDDRLAAAGELAPRMLAPSNAIDAWIAEHEGPQTVRSLRPPSAR